MEQLSSVINEHHMHVFDMISFIKKLNTNIGFWLCIHILLKIASKCYNGTFNLLTTKGRGKSGEREGENRESSGPFVGLHYVSLLPIILF